MSCKHTKILDNFLEITLTNFIKVPHINTILNYEKNIFCKTIVNGHNINLKKKISSVIEKKRELRVSGIPKHGYYVPKHPCK